VNLSFSSFRSVAECTSHIHWPNATIYRICQLWRKPGLSPTDSPKSNKTVTPFDIHMNTNCQASGQESQEYEGHVCPVESDIGDFFIVGISCVPRKQSLDCAVL